MIRHRNEETCKCGDKAAIAISAKMRVFKPRYSEAAGAYFTSEKQKKRMLSEKGLVENG